MQYKVNCTSKKSWWLGLAWNLGLFSTQGEFISNNMKLKNERKTHYIVKHFRKNQKYFIFSSVACTFAAESPQRPFGW